jgi:hypothetical protein
MMRICGFATMSRASWHRAWTLPMCFRRWHKRAVADEAINAEVERSRRVLAALREEVNELKAELLRPAILI